MVKNHLKTLNAPNTWRIKKKGMNFVTRPNPGQSSFRLGISLNVVMRDMLKIAKTAKEVKYILNNQQVFVDGRRKKDIRSITGFMDVLTFPKTKKAYRVLMDKKGKILLLPIKETEAGFKICRIIGKTMVKGSIQLNLYDSKNILIKKGDFKVGDSVLLKLPEQQIKEHLKFDKKAKIFLIKGKHKGQLGTVEDIIKNKITYKDKSGNVYETKKEFAFVVGKDKPLVTIE